MSWVELGLAKYNYLDGLEGWNKKDKTAKKAQKVIQKINPLW